MSTSRPHRFYCRMRGRMDKDRAKLAGWVAATFFLAMFLVLSSNFRTSPQKEPIGLLVAGDLREEVRAFKESELSIFLVMDSQVYLSKQAWNATVLVESPENMSGTEVWLKGILSEGSQKLLKSEDLDIKKGANIIVFKGNMPSCYGCARIKEGPYNVTASITLEGEVLAEATNTIELSK